MVHLVGPKVEAFCQLWFDGFNVPKVSKVYEYEVMWHEFAVKNSTKKKDQELRKRGIRISPLVLIRS